MRLLNVDTKEIRKFQAAPYPPYAILSHTWGDDGDEVTFQEMTASSSNPDTFTTLRNKPGYVKIEQCCTRARDDEIEYVWIDTCCIDKTSSAELSEAINSMYAWYEAARICYAYLSDVPSASSVIPKTSKGRFDQDGIFRGSRWFSRGWTLQELIAPSAVEFYAADWTEIGTKASLTSALATITGIDERVLGGRRAVTSCNVAERMSWAADRSTKRVEDTAYSLLGLFGVAMPLLYGEGRRSFLRLQDEIMRITEDCTMLAWQLVPPSHRGGQQRTIPKTTLSDAEGIAAAVDHHRARGRPPLADSPAAFHMDAADWRDWRYSNLELATQESPNSGRKARDWSKLGTLAPDYSPPQMTARGLRAWLSMHRCTPTVFLAFLNCYLHGRLVCAYLRRVGGPGSNMYERVVPPQGACSFLPMDSSEAFKRRLAYITVPQGGGEGVGGDVLSPFVEATEVELRVCGSDKVVCDWGGDARQDGRIYINFLKDELPIVRCVYDKEHPFLVLLRRDWCEVAFLSDKDQLVIPGESAKQRILPNHSVSNGAVLWDPESHTWGPEAVQALRGLVTKVLSPFERRDRILRHGDGFTVAVSYKRLGTRSVVRLTVTEISEGVDNSAS